MNLANCDMIKLGLHTRLTATRAVTQAVLRHFSCEISYRIWDAARDDFGHKMSDPLRAHETRETHPNLLWLRLTRDASGSLFFDADIEVTDEIIDHRHLGCVPIALGMTEVRNLICDKNVDTRIMIITSEWPKFLIYDQSDLDEEFYQLYGDCDDSLPF